MKLKDLRLSKGLTVKQLSNKSGLAVGYISDLENGKADNPSKLTLSKLANALDVSISDLLDESS